MTATRPEPPSPRPPQGAGSPWRWLLVLVPLAVIAVVGTRLVGHWIEVLDEMAREEPAPARLPGLLDLRDAPPVLTPPATVEFPSDFAAGRARDTDAAIESGARAFRVCTTCHPAEKDAPHRLGPNLWGVAGRAKAANPTFRYSAALREKGGIWSDEELAAYLRNPRAFAPGTSMAFAGIRDDERLWDVIAYLHTLAGEPAPR